MESPKDPGASISSPQLVTPLITVAQIPEQDGYFSQDYGLSGNLASSLNTPPSFRSRMSSVSRASGRRQSVVTNVVIPTHLLNAVSGSAQYSSAGQEMKRRQSCARQDPREQFDAAAFANIQSAAVLRAMGKDPKSRSRASSITSGRRKLEGRRASGIDPSTSSLRLAVNPASHLMVPGAVVTPSPLGISRNASPLASPNSIMRKPSISTQVETLASPPVDPTTILTPRPALTRKKSMVTFVEPAPPVEKAHSYRKKSIATLTSPSASAYHTPTSQTPVSEVPLPVKSRSIVSYTEVTIEFDDKEEIDAKSALSADYFGNYTMTGNEDEDTARSYSHGRGPLDTPGSTIPDTSSARNSGWRWGGPRTPMSSNSAVRDQTRRNTSINAGRPAPRSPSVWGRSKSMMQDVVDVVAEEVQETTSKMRRNTMDGLYAQAITRQLELRRSRWFMLFFEWTSYALIAAFVYFVFIGTPLWKGTTYWLWYSIKYKLQEKGTWTIIAGLSIFYAFTPLLIFFEPDPPARDDLEKSTAAFTPGAEDTCLLIPCYKSEHIIGPTLLAATRIFPAANIFVIANGNSPTPLDDTEAVCTKYGVNHVWSPVGSKIVAQFVGCYAAKGFKNVMLIDDDCLLPPNIPIVSDQLQDNVKCIGYTIKSVGPHSSRGTLAQQAQDMEYKLSGIQRALAGKIGSVLFPHGAISLWDREFLIRTFHQHPGFSVSEDWFFGHVARELGCRTKMCTSVFIETETPHAVFFSSGGARGGFGEMTVFKQRFTRWNFFFVNGMYYNLVYILFSWKLGWHEIFTKILCFQEIFETLLYLATPLVFPVTFYVRPLFCTYLILATFGVYFLNVAIFNEIHLRRKRERVGTFAVYVYYMPYKIVLTVINVASCYYALFRYATYFAKRHPKVIEDARAVGVVLQLEESIDDDSTVSSDSDYLDTKKSDLISPNTSTFPDQSTPLTPMPARGGRRMTVTAIGAQTQVKASDSKSLLVPSAPTTPISPGFGSSRRMTVTTLGPRLDVQSVADGVRKPSVDSPALLMVGGRKFSIPGQPGTEGIRRLSSSNVSGLLSPGAASSVGAPSFRTSRSALSAMRRLSDEGLDPHSQLANPTGGFVLAPAPPGKKRKPPPSPHVLPISSPAASVPSIRSSRSTKNAAPQVAAIDDQTDPRNNSDHSTDSHPTARGRLFSVAEVEDTAEEDDFHSAADDFDRRSGSFTRIRTNSKDLMRTNSRESTKGGGRRRKSSGVFAAGLIETARRMSVARKRSIVGGIRGRRTSRAMSRSGDDVASLGQGGEVPPHLLDQLAEVQGKLAQNRVEVVDWCIDDVYRAKERPKTDDSRSAV